MEYPFLLPDVPELADSSCACPVCDERHLDKLHWLNDEIVECQQCGCRYQP